MKYIKCSGEVFEFNLLTSEGICQNCKKVTSVFFIPSQKKRWCKDCFSQFFERRVKRTVEKYKMFIPHQRIGVCLSGGKDSSSLLWALKKIYPELSLLGIHINLGIGYYSDIAEEAVKRLCEKIGIPLFTYNLKKEEGYSIDDFVFTHYKRKICAVCGSIKRYLFSKIAKQLNLDALATGHHLDDLVSTMLSLFFQGDFSSLLRLSPVIPPLIEGQAKKIKPLCTSPEMEIFYYSVLNELPLEGCSCPHGEITPSKKIKKIIEDLEKENHQIKYQLFSVFNKKLIPLIRLKKEKEILRKCKLCEQPTDSLEEICGRCRKIMLLEKVPERKLEITLEEFLEKRVKLSPKDYVVFDLREKEDFEKDSLPDSQWLSSEYLGKSYRELRKFLKPYRGKIVFSRCYRGITSYFFTLKLRKLGFKAFSIKR